MRCKVGFSPLIMGCGWSAIIPHLSRGGEENNSFLSVNIFHVEFGIVSEIHYLCQRESVQVLSLFSCPFRNCGVVCRKKACNLSQITPQSASNYKMFCVKVRANLTDFSCESV